MRKIDLHCHLDGSLPVETVQRLAKRSGIALPKQEEALAQQLHVSDTCESLLDYLKCFDLPVACLQTEENLYEATYDILMNAKKEGIQYMELRFAPWLHTQQGLSLEQILGSVTAGMKKACETAQMFAGIIVCGMRDHQVRKNIQMLEAAMKFWDKGVCALDIAGNEVDYPPQVQEELFMEANRCGFPFTIHAGECGSVENVLWSIRMGAKRIGHGIALKDHPEAMKECAQRQVAVELCPISNFQTKAVSDPAEYPFRTFVEAGISVTVNTDNRTVSNTTIQREFELLQNISGLTEDEESQIYRNGVLWAFADESVKKVLLKQQ